jgi:TRAP-type C4-dicarboxylate transport system permease small subunit
MKSLFNIWFGVGRVAQGLAGTALLMMFLLTLIEVLGRTVSVSITGAWEIISFLGGIIIGLAVPQTSQKNGHVNVDFVLVKMPKMLRNVTNVFTRALALAFFTLLVWGLFSVGIDYVASGEAGQSLKIPHYLMAFALSGAFLIQAVQFVFDIIRICGGNNE